MTLQEFEHYYELPIAGEAVSRIVVDHAAFRLYFHPQPGFVTGKHLMIELPFSLVSGDTVSVHDPWDCSTLGTALAVLLKVVQHGRGYKDGRLEVVFTDETRLTVHHRDSPYEAWHFLMDPHLHLIGRWDDVVLFS